LKTLYVILEFVYLVDFSTCEINFNDGIQKRTPQIQNSNFTSQNFRAPCPTGHHLNKYVSNKR